jgi:hypothetical protein
MKECFVHKTISEISANAISGPVKFYGRVARRELNSSDLVLVEDGGVSVIVDISRFENVVLEEGEQYRFAGESVFLDGQLSGITCKFIALMCPVRVDGYEGDMFEKAVSMRRRFEVEFHSLVGYATKRE